MIGPTRNAIWGMMQDTRDDALNYDDKELLQQLRPVTHPYSCYIVLLKIVVVPQFRVFFSDVVCCIASQNRPHVLGNMDVLAHELHADDAVAENYNNYESLDYDR